jgi:diguanylate cyclase (GGDEF)-like protein
MDTPQTRLLFWLILALLLIVAVQFEAYVRANEEIEKAESKRLAAHVLSEELRRSADDLDNLSKTYLTTRDAAYKHAFMKILDIQQGKRPRGDTQPLLKRPSSIGAARDLIHSNDRIPLFELMQKSGHNTPELAKLKAALLAADGLATIQLKAMAIMESQPDDMQTRLRAHEMISSDDFFRTKSRMLHLISEAQQMTDERFLKFVGNARTIAAILRITFISLGVFLLLMLWRGWWNERRRSSGFEERSYVDPLTSLSNRAFLDMHLKESTANASKNNGLVVLGMVDLNGFKEINDCLGHLHGDEVLRGVAKRLREACREEDVVARFGGDEFVIVFSAPATHLETTVTRMRTAIEKAFEKPITDGFSNINVGAAVGIAIFPRDATTLAGLVKCADEAMYAVKNNARHVAINVYTHDTQP